MAAVGLAGSVPVGSAFAVFSKQATVTGNTTSTAAAFPRCYSDAVTTDSPASYWRLDETSGTAATDSKGSNTGTYTNGVTLGQSGALPDIVNNKAAGFNGSSQYVNVPYSASLNPAQFTVEAWVKPTGGSGNWRSIAGSWALPSDWRGYVLGITTSDQWYFQTGNGSATSEVDGPVVVLNTWTHLVGTYGGSTASLYVNGTLVGSTAASYSGNPSPVPFIIGGEYASGTPQTFLPGSIDDVAVYNTALTAAKIRSHYNAGRCYKDGVLADSPTAYWRLGESSGSTAGDGVRGRHGSYVGTPTLAAAGALNGDSNTAVTFDGTSQYVSVPYETALNPAQLTVEAWAKPTGGAGTARTVIASQDTNKGYLLGIGTDNKWRFTVGTGAATTVVTGSTVTLNSWAHLVATYDGTTATLYVDGISVGTASVTVSVNTTRPVGMGATDAGGSWAGYFPGSIDEVALYNTALSQTRVQAHYLLGRSYQDTVLDSGAISYWRLGEASGTSAADGKGTNTGTYTNGPTLAQSGALAGDADTSASFDGSNDYVRVPASGSLNITSAMTMEAWIYKTDTNAQVPIVEYNNGSGFGPHMWNYDDGTKLFVNFVDTGGGNNQVMSAGGVIAAGQWYHVVATYDGNLGTLYVNGAQVAQATLGAHTLSTNMAFYIGTRASSGEVFNGRLDDVAVYSRALSATEVQMHYDSGRQ